MADNNGTLSCTLCNDRAIQTQQNDRMYGAPFGYSLKQNEIRGTQRNRNCVNVTQRKQRPKKKCYYCNSEEHLFANCSNKKIKSTSAVKSAKLRSTEAVGHASVEGRKRPCTGTFHRNADNDTGTKTFTNRSVDTRFVDMATQTDGKTHVDTNSNTEGDKYLLSVKGKSGMKLAGLIEGTPLEWTYDKVRLTRSSRKICIITFFLNRHLYWSALIKSLRLQMELTYR